MKLHKFESSSPEQFLFLTWLRTANILIEGARLKIHSPQPLFFKEILGLCDLLNFSFSIFNTNYSGTYSDGSELSSIQPYYHPKVCIRHQEQTSVYRKLMLNFWAVAAVLIRLTTELLLPLKLCCLLNNLCWVFLKLNNHEQKKF